MKNMSDRWIAFNERYDVIEGRNEELRRIYTMGCLQAIGYNWRWLYIVKDRNEEKLSEMRKFLKDNREAMED